MKERKLWRSERRILRILKDKSNLTFPDIVTIFEELYSGDYKSPFAMYLRIDNALTQLFKRKMVERSGRVRLYKYSISNRGIQQLINTKINNKLKEVYK